MSARTGPLDHARWPDKLVARALSPGPSPALFGYDVESDLARHYSFSESVFLALTGELPTAAQARAFDVALQFAAPAPVNEAPTHAAVLARVCAATTSSIVGTAAIGLAEQARACIAGLAPWLAWLESGAADAPPDGFGAASDEERQSVDRLREALGGAVEVPALSQSPGRIAAVVAVFWACGIRRAPQIECAMTLARLPCVLAEALAAPPANYREYPVLLPPIAYEDEP